MKINERDDNQELKCCTFVKTVLMLLVVIYHSMVFWGGRWLGKPTYESEFLKILSIWLNTFHIYTFTLVSGYIFSYLKYDKNKYAVYSQFIVNKIKRLVVPYLFVVSVWVIPFAVIFLKVTIKDIFVKYILCTSPDQLWFLWMLFGVFLLVWPLSTIIKNNYVALVIIFLSWCVSIFGRMLFENIFCVWTSCGYLPFFIIGMKIQQNKDIFLRKIPNIVYILLDFVVYVIYLLLANMNCNFAIVTCVLFLLQVIGALMAFFTLQEIAQRYTQWENNRVFKIVSKNSMGIYLFHQQVIYITVTYLNGKINPYFNALINFIIAFIVAFIISDILLKFKVTRFLMGEK